MKQFIFGLAGLLTAGVMLMAAWGIVSSWMDRMRELNDAIDFNVK